MTEGNFGGCGKLDTLDWLFFLGYGPLLNLHLVLKLSNMIAPGQASHLQVFRACGIDGLLATMDTKQQFWLFLNVVFASILQPKFFLSTNNVLPVVLVFSHTFYFIC